VLDRGRRAGTACSRCTPPPTSAGTLASASRWASPRERPWARNRLKRVPAGGLSTEPGWHPAGVRLCADDLAGPVAETQGRASTFHVVRRPRRVADLDVPPDAGGLPVADRTGHTRNARRTRIEPIHQSPQAMSKDSELGFHRAGSEKAGVSRSLCNITSWSVCWRPTEARRPDGDCSAPRPLSRSV